MTIVTSPVAASTTAAAPVPRDRLEYSEASRFHARLRARLAPGRAASPGGDGARTDARSGVPAGRDVPAQRGPALG